MDQRPDAAPGLPDDLLPRLAFEGAPVALACVNGSDGRIAAANPALAALLGTAPGRLIGRTFGEGGGDPATGETIWHRADGSTVRLRLRTGPERDGHRVVAVDAIS
uniref:PAS domain-containing protein n=1 Tax=uncultured Methylobacterium sp. TaxID=157278 RepID=UPI00259233F8